MNIYFLFFVPLHPIMQPIMEENMNNERLVLRTEGLVKRYGKRTVVNDVSFDV